MPGNECREWLQDWRYDVISHDKQNDTKSFGVHVIEVKSGEIIKRLLNF